MIRYTQIINSYVSQEGMNGNYVNYVYYSLLVVNTDGTKEIMDGKYKDVSWLFPYLRTAVDEVDELKATVKQLREEMNELLETKSEYFVNSLFPIPEVVGKSEKEALRAIEAEGLIARKTNRFPEGTPENGVVTDLTRDRGNFKIVHVDIRHELPKLVGKPVEEAKAVLEREGFCYEVKTKLIQDAVNGTVLEVWRVGEHTDMRAGILVAMVIPELTGLEEEEAVRRLEAIGVTARVVSEYSDEPVGTVMRWTQTPQKEGQRPVVDLYVSSGAARLKNVDANVTNNSDGELSELRFEAEAELDREKGKLLLRLIGTSGPKSKHSVKAAANCVYEGVIGNEKSHSVTVDGSGVIEAKKAFELAVTIPCAGMGSSAPSGLSITIPTQYGLMKREETLALTLKLFW